MSETVKRLPADEALVRAVNDNDVALTLVMNAFKETLGVITDRSTSQSK